jgi:hypothetical protein
MIKQPKRFWVTSLVAGLVIGIPAVGGTSSKLAQALSSADAVVWAGLDYSLVRMVGPGDFQDPDAIFPGMLESWNSLYLAELLKKTEAAVGKPLKVDVAGVSARNRTATSKQIIAAPGPEDGTVSTHIKAEDLTKLARNIKLESKQGVGLIFVVDRLVKMEQKGAVHIVFFDVASREILASQRKVYKAGGFGFRNYWFRVPKSAVADLKAMVR